MNSVAASWADRKEEENANQDMSLVVDPDAGEEWSPTTPATSPDKGGPKEVHGGNDQHLAFKCDTPDTRTSARMDDDEWKATTPAVSPAEYDAVCSIFEQACTRRGVMSPRDAMGNGSTRDKHDSSPPATDMKWSAAMSPEDLLLQLLAEDRQQQVRDLRKKKWNSEEGSLRSNNVLGGGIEMSATPLSPRVQTDSDLSLHAHGVVLDGCRPLGKDDTTTLHNNTGDAAQCRLDFINAQVERHVGTANT
ncbi:MAG: hypothetical protein ACPIOQ_63810, partial [Promethearchaeia archaeon]